ncbi:hypothetical protein KY347_02695 [Candidatus Woesearchaeota archaeon]|nr:hypothetical protein [Candidatus Woesearchaeota archaeon]
MKTDIDSFWKRQTDTFENIEKAGGFGAYVANEVPDLASAFQADRILRCIDEGTPNGLRAAGEGIAYVKTFGLDKGREGYAAINAGIDAAADAFRDANLEGIFSHEECGAAKLIYGLFSDKFRSQLEKEHGIKSSDELGDYFAKELSAKLGVEYKGSMKINEMARPRGKHITRFTYVDGTGKLNPDGVEGLPQGFVISRDYLGAEQTGVEVAVSINISTGDHGFGDRITPEQPHVLVAVGNPSEPELSLDKLMKELKTIADKYNGRVIVDGFVAPIYTNTE